MNKNPRKFIRGAYIAGAALIAGAVYFGSQNPKQDNGNENLEGIVCHEEQGREPCTSPQKTKICKLSFSPSQQKAYKLSFSEKQKDCKESLREAVTNIVLGDANAAEAQIKELAEDDKVRQTQKLPANCFAEFANLGKAFTIEDRDKRVAELKKLLNGNITEDLKTKIKQELSKDEYERAKEFIFASNTSRALEFIKKPVENANLLNLTEDKSAMAADALVGVFESILGDRNSFTGHQYEAYIQAKAAVSKYPESKEKKWAESYIKGFEEKRKKVAFENIVKEGDERAKQKDFDGAVYSYRFALEFASEEKGKPAEGKKKTIEQRIAHAEAEISKRKPDAVKARASPETLTELCLNGDNAKLPEISDKELKAMLKFAIALSKNEPDAVKEMKKLGTPEAKAWLAEHDLRAKYSSEVTERNLKTIEYIAVGADPAKNAKFAALESGVHMLAGGTVEGLGIGYGVSAAFRALGVALGKNPVPNDDIVIAAKKLLAKYPDDKFADEVAVKLARIYEKKEDLDQAVMFYAFAKGNKAESGLENKCDKEINRLDKLIIEREQKLAKAKAVKKPEYEKSDILSNPLLLRAFNIDPDLLDGDLKNREIAKISIEKIKGDKYMLKSLIATKGSKELKEEQKVLSDNEAAKLMSFMYYAGSEENSKEVAKAIEYFGGVGYSEKFRAYVLGGINSRCVDTSIGLAARVNEKNASIGVSANDGRNSANIYYKQDGEKEIGLAYGTDNGTTSDVQKLRCVEDGGSRIVPEASKVAANEKVAVGAGAEHDKGFGVFGTVALVKNKDAEGANDVVRNKMMSEGRDLIQNTQDSVSTELNGGYNLGTEQAKAEAVQYLPRDIAVLAGSEGKDLTNTRQNGYVGVKLSMSTFVPEAKKYVNLGIKIVFKDGKLKIYPSIDALTSSDLKDVYDY